MESGTVRVVAQYSLMALIFTLGRHGWTNRINYDIGKHQKPDGEE